MGRLRASAAIMGLMLTLLGAFFTGGTRTLAQDASPPRPSHVHTGDCDELGPVVQPLTALTVPTGAVSGNGDAVVAEAAFTVIPQPIDELLAADHALKVHLSKDQIETYLACGDIGGALDADGALIVGMKELGGSGYAGIAYLLPRADGTTSVSVMIAKVIPLADGASDAGATQDEAGAEPVAADAAPEIVDVVLSEFTIDMATEIPAGPVRFNISNVGNAPHAFVLEGEGVRKRLASNVPPGDTAVLNVVLEPGTYIIFCPVGEGAHREKGMELELTVT